MSANYGSYLIGRRRLVIFYKPAHGRYVIDDDDDDDDHDDDDDVTVA